MIDLLKTAFDQLARLLDSHRLTLNHQETRIDELEKRIVELENIVALKDAEQKG